MAISTQVKDSLSTAKKKVVETYEDIFVSDLDKAVKNGSIADAVNVAAGSVPMTDQTHTAIVLQNIGQSNKEYGNMGADAGDSVWKSYQQQTGNGTKYPSSDETKKKNEANYGNWALMLSMPIFDNATLERTIQFAQEPIPTSTWDTNVIQQFKSVQPLRMTIRGTVSNMMNLRFTPFTTTTRRNSGLPRIRNNMLATAALNVGTQLKAKLMKKYSKQLGMLSTAWQMKDMAVGAVQSIMDGANGLKSVGASLGMKGLAGKGGPGVSSMNDRTMNTGSTLCQVYIATFDSLARMGNLFTVYYMGIEYKNMAILSIKPSNKSTNNNSMDVVVELQQINRVVYRTKGSGTTETKPTGRKRIKKKATGKAGN